MNKENRWIGNLEKSPDNDGLYYVYTMNCMDNSNDILKLQFKNGQWQEFGDDYDRIIAWKKIPKKKITDKLEWLKKHHNELKIAFNYDVEFDYNNFEIAETLIECLCEYPLFLYDGYIRLIDNIYVIRII